MKMTVLGCGRWGSFITWYLSHLHHEVTAWGRPGSRSLHELQENGKNAYVELPSEITLTDDLEKAVQEADVIMVSIPSQSLRELGEQMLPLGAIKKPVVLCMKGLEQESGLRLSEVMLACGYRRENLAVWVGPGHIQEFTAGHPNCMVMDGYNHDLICRLVDACKSKLIRFYYGNDIIGSEIGAAAKNVMGIVAGILDGCELSSLKGPLMARGAREVARLILAMGGNELSAYGLSHLGDYETTLFSPYSNNRRYGEALARGEHFGKLAEGVYTTDAMYRLGEKYGVDLPITRAAYRVLYHGDAPLEELSGLFERKTVEEFWK